jgi:ribonuclease D
MRRQQYLQYQDVLLGDIPSLITNPDDLISAFAMLREDPFWQGPFGLDAEWDEETKGAAVLQLSNEKMVLLIDVPALSSTLEGLKALGDTVGRLLDCPESVVVGFACRQDLSRLRASPCAKKKNDGDHWLSGTSAVIDIQKLVGNVEPKLFKAGLSRVCQHYFGKPLDKAEQCSLWSGRPLSDHQRSYAALDSWVCVGIYEKLKKETP